MHWTEIIIKIASKDTDIAADILQMTSPAGIYIEDYSNIEYEILQSSHIEMIDEELLNKDKETALIHLYIEPDINPAEALAFIEQRFSAEEIIFQNEIKHIKEEDWANNWKQYFKPIEIGEKITIKPTWEDYDNRENRIILELDPSMSFGSGQHETTKLCMELLEKYVDEDTQMLDVGTGSGILSAEALLLGAKAVTAVDIDPLSVRVAMENAVLNKVQGKINVRLADLTNGIDGKFNLITANIVADIILKLLDDIDRVITDGGILIVSGIIDTREEDVVAALNVKEFKIMEIRREGSWVAISARSWQYCTPD